MSQSDDLQDLDEIRADGSQVTLGPAERAVLLDREMSGLDLGSICSEDLLRSERDEASSSDDESSSCLLYTSPSPRDRTRSRMPSSA